VQEPSGKKPAAHYQYELRGVVVHSGSAFAGHYYSYIKVRGSRVCSGSAPAGQHRHYWVR